MENKKKNFKILSPTAILGYGFPAESFMNGICEEPDLIAVDAGSVDPGPYYLGSGKSFTDKTGVKRDLRYIIREGIKRKIPIVIGTCGGCGAAPHLYWCRKIVEDIAREEKLSFRMGLVYSDVDKKEIIFKEQSDIVLAGRAYDPSVFSAFPIYLGFDPGLAIHLGKILECAAIAAEPGSGSDSVLGILKKDSFVLKPLNKERRFTKESVAAHSLYEKSDPYYLPGPGGSLNLTDVKFKELSDGKD